jgi:hypothetical protein
MDAARLDFGAWEQCTTYRNAVWSAASPQHLRNQVDQVNVLTCCFIQWDLNHKESVRYVPDGPVMDTATGSFSSLPETFE